MPRTQIEEGIRSVCSGIRGFDSNGHKPKVSAGSAREELKKLVDLHFGDRTDGLIVYCVQKEDGTYTVGFEHKISIG